MEIRTLSFQAIDPSTGEPGHTYEGHSPEQVKAILSEMAAAQPAWQASSLSDRAAWLRRAAGVLRERSDEYARLMAVEMGKPLAQGRAEIEKCATACEYYADLGAGFLTSQEIQTEAHRSLVTYRPLGIVLAVMPWNFPFWQVVRFVAPALMAGNQGVLKHASNVPGCALALEAVFRDAGFPDTCFRTLMIGSGAVADVIADPRVKAVTLTGSTPAGQAVAAKAGEHLKKTVLELGGSDPYVILQDADLDVAVDACVAGRLNNAGQSCIAAKRLIVVEAVADAFEQKLVDAMAKKRIGHPINSDADMGPMARADLRDELHEQVLRSVDAGANVALGGEIPEGPGAFYPATILTDVTSGMVAYEEELFGPVAAVIRAKDQDDAVRIANDSPFGLGAAVFTQDLELGERIATEQLNAGSCFVNDFVKSDPRLPFGGINESGYGRELGPFGMYEFVNIKTVQVA